MTGIFISLLNMSLAAGWVVLAILALRLIFRRAPKAFAAALWALAAIRLVLPWSIKSVLSLIPSRETVPPTITTSPHPAVSSGFEAVNNQINPMLEETFAPAASAAEKAPLAVITEVAAWVWLVGAALMLLYAAFSYFRLCHTVKGAKEGEKKVFRGKTVQTPFILGVIRPKIYLPYGMDERTEELVLCHERAHLRRGDHFWKPFGWLLLSVYWFNPLMWLGYILFTRDIELACDEKVAEKLDIPARADYSEALLKVSRPGKLVSACPLAFGEVGIKARVRSVLNYKKPAFWIILAAILASVIAAVCLLTDPVEKDIHHKVENIVLSAEHTFEDDVALLEDKLLPKWRSLREYPYPEGELLEDIRPNLNRMSMLSDSYWQTAAIIGHYPTPNLRHIKTEKGEHYYAVYMTDRGARYYVFFDHEGQPYGYPVYMAKKLSHAAFAELKVGDPIGKVERIDPAAKTYSTYFPAMQDGGTAKLDEDLAFTGSYQLTGVHLLTDGVLEIRYAYDEDGGYVIRELDYHADFIGRNNVTELIGDDADEHIKAMDNSYEILEKDYIQKSAEKDKDKPLAMPEGDYQVDDVIYYNGAFSFIEKRENAPYYRFEGKKLSVAAGDNGVWEEMGRLEACSPTEEEIKKAFDVPEMWSNGYSREEFIENAAECYFLKSNKLFFLLVIAEDGNYYMVQGGYALTSPSTTEPEDTTEPCVRWIERLMPLDPADEMMPPALTVTVGEESWEPMRGTYSWESERGSCEGDSAHPLENPKWMQRFETSEDTATLTLAREPQTVSVRRWSDRYLGDVSKDDQAKETGLIAGELTLENGGWIYEVHAEWAAGNCNYAFYIVKGETPTVKDITEPVFLYHGMAGQSYREDFLLPKEIEEYTVCRSAEQYEIYRNMVLAYVPDADAEAFPILPKEWFDDHTLVTAFVDVTKDLSGLSTALTGWAREGDELRFVIASEGKDYGAIEALTGGTIHHCATILYPVDLEKEEAPTGVSD
ncbi:MAG: M56 family metallopeptidase [Clostridia bacterium]|nr:M56 family metallopeptidase [Clostridia bacterium]